MDEKPDMRPIEIRPFANGGFVVSRRNGPGASPEDLGAYSSADHMLADLKFLLGGPDHLEELKRMFTVRNGRAEEIVEDEA